MATKRIDDPEGAARDPRPLLSISFVTGNAKAALPGVFETAPGAQHRYEILKHDLDGFDRSDLTILWVPMVPDPMQWVGVVGARESARPDGKVLVVFTKTKGFSPAQMDDIEGGIRESLAGLGGLADEYKFVEERRTASKKDGTMGTSNVIEAINSFGRAEQSGFDAPLLVAPNWVWTTQFPKEIKDGYHVKVCTGTLRVGDELRSHVVLPNGRMDTFTVQSIYRWRAPTGQTYDLVDELARFEAGTVVFSRGAKPDQGTRLVLAQTVMAASARLRLSNPWTPGKQPKPGKQGKTHVPKKGELMPTYLPGQASPLPATVLTSEEEPEGSVVVLHWKVRLPMFPGRWMIVDHGTPRVYTAELIEALDTAP